MEYGETFYECASRELLEETGVAVEQEQLKLLTFTNSHYPEANYHYLSVIILLEVKKEEFKHRRMEPDKNTAWEW